MSRIPDESWPLLEGLDVLVLDALRYEPHPTHFSLSEALAVIEPLKPRRTFLTHLSHSFDHGPTQAAAPASGGPGLRRAATGVLSGIRVSRAGSRAALSCSQESGTRCLPTRSSSIA